MTRIQ